MPDKFLKLAMLLKDPDAVAGAAMSAAGAGGVFVQIANWLEPLSDILAFVLMIGNVGLMVGGWFLLKKRLDFFGDKKDDK